MIVMLTCGSDDEFRSISPRVSPLQRCFLLHKPEETGMSTSPPNSLASDSSEEERNRTPDPSQDGSAIEQALDPEGGFSLPLDEAVPFSLRRSDGPYVDNPTSSSPLPCTQLPNGRWPNVASPTESLGTDHLGTETRPNHPPVETVFEPFLRDPVEGQILTSNAIDPDPGPSSRSSPSFIFLYDNITIAQILHANPNEPTNLTPARLDDYELQIIDEKRTIAEDTASHVEGMLWKIANLDFWQDDWREKCLNWGYGAVEVMVSHTHFLMGRAGTVGAVLYAFRGGVGVWVS